MFSVVVTLDAKRIIQNACKFVKRNRKKLDYCGETRKTDGMFDSLTNRDDIIGKQFVEQLRDGIELECGDVFEESLYEYTKHAFRIAEPGKEYIDNWHVEFLCDHLQALTNDRLGGEHNLLTNIPVGCMKSLIFCVFWPTWVWTHYPESRWLFASYSSDFAMRDSIARRRLIKSEWYRSRWGYRSQIQDDQDQKSRFASTRGGWMLSTSVGGIGTGEHPNFVVIDDPHSARQAASEVERQAAIDWIENTIISRGAAIGVKRAVVMQRLHTEDLSGHLIKKGGWVNICLPMFYEPDRMEPTPLGLTDRRSIKNDLLFPDLWSSDAIEKMNMSPHVSAGQLQQRPSSLEGEFFKREWFNTFIPLAEVSRIPESDNRGLLYNGRTVRYWDRAGSQDGGDYTVGILMQQDRGIYTVIDMIRGQWDQYYRDQIILRATRSDVQKCDNYTVVLEQEPGSAGKDMFAITARMLAGYRVESDRPTGKKHIRADPWASQLAAGNVRIVQDDSAARWNIDLIDEHCAFRPDLAHAHDDIVDACSGGFNYLAQHSQYSDLGAFIEAGYF